MDYILSNGSKVKVDEEDAHLLEQYNWCTNNGYVFRTKQRNFIKKRYYLHREIMNPPEGMVVDHINGDPSDNRRSNLRICTQEENAKNRRKSDVVTSSHYKGVTKRGNAFEASIRSDKETIYIGTFTDEIHAAIAYNEKATQLFGEYARLNDIPDAYSSITPQPIKQKSKYRGVTYHERVGAWCAAIQLNKKRRHLGYFEKESDAAEAYNKAAVDLLGDKAKLNAI